MIFDTFSLLTGTVHRPRVHRTGFNEAYATILSPRSRTRSDHNPIFPEDRIINATPKRLRKPAFRIVGPCITRLWRCVERERERERGPVKPVPRVVPGSWFLYPLAQNSRRTPLLPNSPPSISTTDSIYRARLQEQDKFTRSEILSAIFIMFSNLVVE